MLMLMRCLVPGAFVPSQGSALGYRGGFTTGGVAEDANQFILDGINNNGTGTMEIGARVNIDALQEFKIETSSYSAQLGRFGGADCGDNRPTTSGEASLCTDLVAPAPSL